MLHKEATCLASPCTPQLDHSWPPRVFQACVPKRCVALGMQLPVSGFLGCKVDCRSRGSKAEEPAEGLRLGLLAEGWREVGGQPCGGLLSLPQESP